MHLIMRTGGVGDKQRHKAPFALLIFLLVGGTEDVTVQVNTIDNITDSQITDQLAPHNLTEEGVCQSYASAMHLLSTETGLEIKFVIEQAIESLGLNVYHS